MFQNALGIQFIDVTWNLLPLWWVWIVFTLVRFLNHKVMRSDLSVIASSTCMMWFCEEIAKYDVAFRWSFLTGSFNGLIARELVGQCTLLRCQAIWRLIEANLNLDAAAARCWDDRIGRAKSSILIKTACERRLLHMKYPHCLGEQPLKRCCFSFSCCRNSRKIWKKQEI